MCNFSANFLLMHQWKTLYGWKGRKCTCGFQSAHFSSFLHQYNFFVLSVLLLPTQTKFFSLTCVSNYTSTFFTLAKCRYTLIKKGFFKQRQNQILKFTFWASLFLKQYKKYLPDLIIFFFCSSWIQSLIFQPHLQSLKVKQVRKDLMYILDKHIEKVDNRNFTDTVLLLSVIQVRISQLFPFMWVMLYCCII